MLEPTQTYISTGKENVLKVDMWKFIYFNCREWYEDIIDHRSYAHILKEQSRILLF